MSKRAQKKIYFSTAEVAEVIGKSTETAREWLRREGALVKRGGRYYATLDRLIASFPEAFQGLAR